MADSIKETEELRRVLALPRRAPVVADELVQELTEILKTPEGAMRLRPLQALALHDIGIYGGAFLNLDVGEGKTLISLLAPLVLGSQRPLLMLRANLIAKTAEERAELARHWRIPNHICFMSYQMLGVVGWARWLEEVYQPDCIIFDEVQAVKSLDAAVTKRFARYMAKNPHTAVVAMTGTIMSKSLRDFAHPLAWALKQGAPIPLNMEEIDRWALALDEKLDNEFSRIEPGALMQMADPSDLPEGDLIAARRGFRRRLRETPGVVSSAEHGSKVDVGLTIRPLTYDVAPITHAHFKTLRNDKKTPEGYDVWEAAQVWQHARELALGFHQVWDPQPPEAWRNARRDWFSLVREILSRSRQLDSPDHVAQHCDLGRLPNGDKIPADRLAHWQAVLAAWRNIKDTFVPNPVPVWHDDSALRVAAKWMQESPGIVWVEHVPFGERLSALTGARYYGAKGLAADGHFVNHADGKSSIICSVDANKEGRNLQRFHRNLITTFAESAALNHQLIGRTHRSLQKHPVTVDVFVGCAENISAWRKANAGAVAIKETVGSQNKLLIADRSQWPTDLEMDSWSGPRWEK